MKKVLFGNTFSSEKWFSFFWFAFRFQLGISVAIHAGWPKITGSGGSPEWFVSQVQGLGFSFPSPGFWAAAASWGEFLGGLLVAVGLLTRLAAFQLVFQFFVIAFLWYEKPDPFTGMYYQNLLFWSFLLITAGGGGRFSIDQMIINRTLSTERLGKTMAAAGMAAMMTFSNNSIAQTVDSTIVKEAIAKAKGKWAGALTYLDYTSHRDVSIDATLDVKRSSDVFYQLYFDFPKEPGHGWKDDVNIHTSSGMVNDAKIIDAKRMKNGYYNITLEEQGRDDNKNALIRTTWLLIQQELTITKKVKMEDADQWIQRNEFRLYR